MFARRRILAHSLPHIVGGGFALFSVLPKVWLGITSFKTEAEIVNETLTYWPEALTFQNYSAVWAQSDYPRLVWNSAVTTFYTVTAKTKRQTVKACEQKTNRRNNAKLFNQALSLMSKTQGSKPPANADSDWLTADIGEIEREIERIRFGLVKNKGISDINRLQEIQHKSAKV